MCKCVFVYVYVCVYVCARLWARLLEPNSCSSMFSSLCDILVTTTVDNIDNNNVI